MLSSMFTAVLFYFFDPNFNSLMQRFKGVVKILKAVP
jgi:hypothetical protein